MSANPTMIRKMAVFRGRDYAVTFRGAAATQVQSVSPVDGAYRTVWKEGRPVGDVVHGAISNARMRSAYEEVHPVRLPTWRRDREKVEEVLSARATSKIGSHG